MKINCGKRTLEGHALFPYIAWALIIGFAFFVYNISVGLKSITTELEIQTQLLQEQAKTPPHEIKDFEQKDHI